MQKKILIALILTTIMLYGLVALLLFTRNNAETVAIPTLASMGGTEQVLTLASASIQNPVQTTTNSAVPVTTIAEIAPTNTATAAPSSLPTNTSAREISGSCQPPTVWGEVPVISTSSYVVGLEMFQRQIRFDAVRILFMAEHYQEVDNLYTTRLGPPVSVISGFSNSDHATRIAERLEQELYEEMRLWHYWRDSNLEITAADIEREQQGFFRFEPTDSDADSRAVYESAQSRFDSLLAEYELDAFDFHVYLCRQALWTKVRNALADTSSTRFVVEAGYILVPSNETAMEILDRLQSGESFAALVEESIGTSQYSLGWSQTKGFLPEFRAAVEAGEIGVPIGPVEEENGYYIILIHGREVQEYTPDELEELIELEYIVSLKQFVGNLEITQHQTWYGNLPEQLPLPELPE